MAVEVRVVAEGDGLVVIKEAGHLDADALRSETDRLRAAAHPGVVRVLASVPTAEGWELRTAHGGAPLGRDRAIAPRVLGRVAASAAATLADLHDRGVVHGRLESTRILVAPSGGAVLCGFGPSPAVDDGDPPSAADDVAALGTIVLDALDRGGSDRTSHALRVEAERARADPATRRPPARRLADDLTRVAGISAPRRPPLTVVLAGGVAVAVAAIVAARQPHRPAARVAGVPEVTTTSWTLPAPSGVSVDGNVVTVDGRRYVVGDPDDLVVVADWDCDGEVTAALLRASTGEVLVFSPFSADRALSVTLAQRVDGAVEMAIAEQASGCAELGVRDAAGVRTVVGLAEDP